MVLGGGALGELALGQAPRCDFIPYPLRKQKKEGRGFEHITKRLDDLLMPFPALKQR